MTSIANYTQMFKSKVIHINSSSSPKRFVTINLALLHTEQFVQCDRTYSAVNQIMMHHPLPPCHAISAQAMLSVKGRSV